jgi:hypothetical protein
MTSPAPGAFVDALAVHRDPAPHPFVRPQVLKTMPSTQAKPTLEQAVHDLVADHSASNGVVAIFKLIDALTRRAAKILAQAKRFGALLEQTIARHHKRRFDAAAVAK